MARADLGRQKKAKTSSSSIIFCIRCFSIKKCSIRVFRPNNGNKRIRPLFHLKLFFLGQVLAFGWFLRDKDRKSFSEICLKQPFWHFQANFFPVPIRRNGSDEVYLELRNLLANKEIFFPNRALNSAVLTDGAARYYFSSTIIPNSYAPTVIRTHGIVARGAMI